jgi:hypothetical protein
MDNSQQIYTKKSILLATFIGGPLVAGFLIYKNFKAFGKESAAQKSLIVSIVFTIVLFWGIFLIPSSIIDKFPNSLIPFIYTGIIALIINKYQDVLIIEYIKNGGLKASNWSAAGYSLVGLIIMHLIIVPIAISLPHEGYEVQSEIYEKTILYSSKKLDKAVSEKIINGIRKSEFMDVNQESDLFLNEENNQYILKVVLPDFKIMSDSVFLYDFNVFEYALNSNSELDKKMVIRFTNPLLTQVQNLPYVQIEESQQQQEISPSIYEGFANLQRYQLNFFQSIYYNTDMPLNDVKIIAKSITKLSTYFPANQPLDLIFLNTGEYYTTKFFIRPEIWENFPFEDKLKSTIGYFTKNQLL